MVPKGFPERDAGSEYWSPGMETQRDGIIRLVPQDAPEEVIFPEKEGAESTAEPQHLVPKCTEIAQLLAC